jgi:hypothetical protein
MRKPHGKVARINTSMHFTATSLVCANSTWFCGSAIKRDYTQLPDFTVYYFINYDVFH